MTVLLEIPDGSPWWLSPNVWVVPGSDPQGPAGLPIVGQSAYLWARVWNNGTERVIDATVRFYWANPAVGFDRNTANTVGMSNVSLNPGENQDVLCLVPWYPIFVNSGHECILAEAFQEFSDPLPNAPLFNVPTDRHVAQRNLSIVMATKKMFSFPFEIHNKNRVRRSFTVEALNGKLSQIKPIMPFLGHDFKLIEREGSVSHLGFVQLPCSNFDDIGKAEKGLMKLELGPNERTGRTIVGELDGGTAVVHIVQKSENKEIGGLTIVIISPEEKQAGGVEK